MGIWERLSHIPRNRNSISVVKDGNMEKSFPIFPFTHLVMEIWEENFKGKIH